MIPVNQLIPEVESNLDAEGSDRYTFARDYQFAINYATRFWISVMNGLLGDNKLSEENLRKLVKTKIFQTSEFSRIHFSSDDLNEEIWSILAIYPEPELDPATDPLTPDPKNSQFVPDVTFIRSKFDAKRLTAEEWSKMKDNIFLAGSPALENSDFKNYSYRNFSTDRPGDDVNEIIEEIEISPVLDNQLVAVKYLASPQEVTAESDTIPFPRSMFDLMVQKTLHFLSVKQGDGTNLWSVSKDEMQQLISIMS